MSKITINKVQTKREMDDFIRLTHRLYADCPQYVPDLDTDIRDTFDPCKNAGLEYSDIQPFVAYDERGNCVGRIAGIINHRANEKWKTKNVRFGPCRIYGTAYRCRKSACGLHWRSQEFPLPPTPAGGRPAADHHQVGAGSRRSDPVIGRNIRRRADSSGYANEDFH